MNHEGEGVIAVPVLDVGWDIHEVVLALWNIPHALSIANDDAANNATLCHPHDTHAHRRALRRLDRALQALWRSLEAASNQDPAQQTTGVIVCEAGEEEGPSENDATKNEISNAAPLFQQTQETASYQSPKDSQGSKHPPCPSPNSIKSLLQSELRSDLLFLFIHLKLHDDHAIQDLVVSCTELIAKIWMEYCSHNALVLDFQDHVLPLLDRIHHANNYRISLAQLYVLNNFFSGLSTLSTADSSCAPVLQHPEHAGVLLTVIHEFVRSLLHPEPHIKSEWKFEQCQLCAGLLGLVLQRYQEGEKTCTLIPWLEEQVLLCQQQQGNIEQPAELVAQLLSSMTHLAMFLTDQALDDLDVKEEGCWILTELAIHVLESVLQLDAALVQSADRLWKTVSSFGVGVNGKDATVASVRDEGKQEDDHFCSMVATLSVRLARLVVVASDHHYNVSIPTATLTFRQASVFPTLLSEDTTWWATTIAPLDLQSAVLTLLRMHKYDPLSVELARLILDFIPPKEDDDDEDGMITWDDFFWRQLATFEDVLLSDNNYVTM